MTMSSIPRDRWCDCGRHSMGRARFGSFEKVHPTGETEVHRGAAFGDCYVYVEATDDIRWLPTWSRDTA